MGCSNCITNPLLLFCSIDQFFECFEELRNSQSSLGNSGIWDWTCSVFNAISFASTLASGSDQVPKGMILLASAYGLQFSIGDAVSYTLLGFGYEWIRWLLHLPFILLLKLSMLSSFFF